MRLLIIEDDEAHLELIEIALRGFVGVASNWATCTRLADAREALERETFDLILSDLSLPDSAYHETLPRVLSMAKGTPVIVLTSLDDRQTILGMIQNGAADCIPKTMLSGLFLERTLNYCLDRDRLLKERLIREKRLQSARSFRDLFDRSRVGLLIASQSGRIILVNPALSQWLDRATDELIGQPISDYGAPVDRESIRQAIAAVCDGRQIERTLEKSFLRRDGQPLWAELILQGIPWPEHGECLFASFFDITERKQFIDRLDESRSRAEEANKAKTAIMAMLSHDIRTPLNSMMGLAEYLSYSALPSDEAECVENIRSSGHQLLELIDSILDFSQAESGRITINPLPTEPHQVVGQVIAVMRSEIDRKGCRLQADLDLPQETLCLDGARLKQILLNLIGNSLKFTPPGGTITLRARAEQPLLIFQVEDTGIGMSPEEQSRLFKPFSQANETVRLEYGGTGLGLSICKTLCELMGGSISVQSEKGKGSTFTFSVSTQPPPL